MKPKHTKLTLQEANALIERDGRSLTHFPSQDTRWPWQAVTDGGASPL